MSQVRSQCCAAATACARLQSRQLPTYPGATQRRAALVAYDAQRPAGQDWRQDRPAPVLCYVPDGRARNPTTCSPTSCVASIGSDRAHFPHDETKTVHPIPRQDWCVRDTARTAISVATTVSRLQPHGIATLIIANRVWVAFRAGLRQSLSGQARPYGASRLIWEIPDIRRREANMLKRGLSHDS